MSRFDRPTARTGIIIGKNVPLDANSVGLLAKSALANQTERQALPVLDAALRSTPDSSVIWQWKGLLHRALNEHTLALTAFKRAAHLSVSDVKILHALARTRLEAGLPAVSEFRGALKAAPADGEIFLGLAAALSAAGRRDEAIAMLSDVLFKSPGWIAGHEVVARLRWEMGDRNTFTQSLEAALTQRSKDHNLWRSYIILLVHACRWDETLGAIHRARVEIGSQIFLDANEAIVWSELDKPSQADVLFARVVGREDMPLAAHRMRHELRGGRIDAASKFGEQWIGRPGAELIWPYLSLAWRILNDPRFQWLEGDKRLVSIVDLDIAQGALDRLATLLRSLHKSHAHGLDQSVRGGTQTDGLVFSRIEPELTNLRSAILAAVHRHIADLPAYDANHPVLSASRDKEARFAGAWSVRLKKQGYHANHIHPMGWLSSAFYVSLPEGSMGGPDRKGWLALGSPPEELNLQLSPLQLIEPKPGRLVLFPSTMWHGTIPFDDGERLTIAFDINRPAR